MQLTELYRPLKIQDFLGLEKAKKILTVFAAHPYPSAWLFSGPPGVGKTAMALALASELHQGAHVIRTASNSCNIDKVRKLSDDCNYAPLFTLDGRIAPVWERPRWKFFLVDEADEVTHAAHIEFLSVLQSLPSRAIFVFTCNSIKKLERRFKSRCKCLEFSSHGLRQELAHFLKEVWTKEAPQGPPLNFEQLAKDSQNNVRDALQNLELKLLELGM